MRNAGFFVVVAALAGLAAAWSTRTSAESQGEKKGTIFASAEKAEFKEFVPGASRATIWGDPDKGAYGAFTKFKPGFDAGMHTHTNDVRIVVLHGAYVYRTDAGETRVEHGCFFSIPGGTKHWSGGDAKDGALFYQEGTGKFDLNPAK
ncbi:MAG TPA: DUF4437 domain-containing protein [Planctomycetota bacterium]|jgi:quercetin dioxygenase-like cupin family protein|nr:DUF4437 domain-containing protein [Planctomycetota bacterium]